MEWWENRVCKKCNFYFEKLQEMNLLYSRQHGELLYVRTGSFKAALIEHFHIFFHIFTPAIQKCHILFNSLNPRLF